MTEVANTRSHARNASPCIPGATSHLGAETSHYFSIDVLGPLRVVVAGRELALSSRRQRALLLLFATNANVVISADRLIDQLWDGAPPPGAMVTLRSYISHIRRALNGFACGRVHIATTDSGYRLEVDENSLDIVRFRSAVASGHRHLRSGQPQEALDAFDVALGMWRGRPLAEIADRDAGVALAAELMELRAGAVEARLRALVETGRHVEAVSGLESLVAAEPFREGPHELLMTSLYRSGRTAEALEVHRRFQSVLRDELGIDVSSRLNQLVTAMLNRDPRLDVLADAQQAGTSLRSEEPPSGDVIHDLLQTLDTVTAQLTALAAVLSQRVPDITTDLRALVDVADESRGFRPATGIDEAIAS